MQKILLISLASAALFCGCDKQAKINSEKIQILSQNIIQLEQNQAKQMAAIQSQLNSLVPVLDRRNNSYFEKNHDDEFFYHTNTLYLLLMVDKKIEAHLQVADSKREAESSLAYSYHTNEMNLIQFYATQIFDAVTDQESKMQDAMTNQEIRMEEKVNAETRRVNTDIRDELLKQIKLSAPTIDGIALQKEMESDAAQIKHELEQINTRLGQMTNLPAGRP